MASGATHLVFGMTAINAPDMSGLVDMAGEAELVRGRGFQFSGLNDVGGAHGFGMFAARSMARFAGLGFEAAFLTDLDGLVGVLLEGVEDVFVASLASCGSDVLGGLVIRW